MGLLRASAAAVDLEPPAGIWLTGFAARGEPSRGKHDPILARAVLLDDGTTQLAIVSCDILGWTPAAARAMRREIASRSDIRAQNILICCTHTHSGPATMPFRGTMGLMDEKWPAEAQGKIIALVAGLPAQLVPARWSYRATHLDGIGYNRQDIAHPTDEELGVISVESVAGQALATLLNYATHAVVLGPRNLLFSADFPGEATRQLQALRGGVALYLQGACGDVDPLVYRKRGWGTGTFEDTQQIGERLAQAAMSALHDVPRTREVTLKVASRLVPIPLDPPPTPAALAQTVAGLEAERDKARREGNAIEEQTTLAMLQWAKELAGAMSAGRVPQILPSELFVAGINELRLIGVPFETYSDIGLGIKSALKPLPTWFVGYANGLYGYCPARWAKAQGGYGPDSSSRWFPELITPIGYGADELIIAEGAALGKELGAPNESLLQNQELTA